MARSSGQILKLLNNISTERKRAALKEASSRRAEGRQHNRLYSRVASEIEKAANKAKKWSKAGDYLSTILALSGMGPVGVGVGQFLGSALGGTIGADKAKKYIEGVETGRGTKFGKELDEYAAGVGSDVFSNALQEGLIAGVSAGTVDKLLGGDSSVLNPEKFDKTMRLGKSKDWWKGPGSILEKSGPFKAPLKAAHWLAEKPGQAVSSLLKAGPGFSKPLAQLTKSEQLVKNLLTGFGKGATMDTLGSQITKNILAERLKSSKIKEKKEKQNIFDYEMPLSMATPRTDEFGGYG